MLTSHTSRLRRAVLGLAAVSTALLSVGLSSTASRADDSGTLTVVGTSDVSDSNLVAAVIKPGFQAAYPQYTLNYLGKGTGAAIAYAEAGSASALLVHAASLENQFVASGFSNEQYGRAIFYGDFVLLGPSSDPAKILTKAPHDIVTAFEDIAAAGVAGTANFVSRGGTPGTTVQEHAIWSLTSGVPECTVSDLNGGGTSPSTVSGDCPISIPYPSWYHATGLTQAPNIINADACNYTGGGCYVFTDRGTYQYLLSTGAISNLHIVTRDNVASARGGANELINSFHAYALNPAAVPAGSQLNTPAAEAFLNWITSPAAQTAVSNYLSVQTGNDPPFIGDAAPALTATLSTGTVTSGVAFTVKGKLSNNAPGTPPLDGETVSLAQTLPGASSSTVVATAVTSATGTYTMKYKPTSNATYAVTTDQIAKVENSVLNPVFGDLLTPTSVNVGAVNVIASVTINSVKAVKGVVTIKGTLKPAPSGTTSQLLLYANRTPLVPTQGLIFQSSQSAVQGSSSFTFTTTLTRGVNWTLLIQYQDPTQFNTATSATKTVQVN